jgi:hypothetical protein
MACKDTHIVPNSGVVSPKVATNIDASFGYQEHNANTNTNTSDNAGSYPNTGIDSPNMDYVVRTSSKTKLLKQIIVCLLQVEVLQITWFFSKKTFGTQTMLLIYN